MDSLRHKIADDLKEEIAEHEKKIKVLIKAEEDLYQKNHGHNSFTIVGSPWAKVELDPKHARQILPQVRMILETELGDLHEKYKAL